MAALSSLVIRQCMRPTLRNIGVQLRTYAGETVSQRTRAQAQKEMKAFWKKNVELGRPWSPHLTIWKQQLPMTLSFYHRLTGIAMGCIWAFGGCALGWWIGMAGGSFDKGLQFLKDLNLAPALITASKFVVALFPCYHYCNGIRHLGWDWAMGFKMTTLYKTGYTSSAIAVCLAAALACYKYNG